MKRKKSYEILRKSQQISDNEKETAQLFKEQSIFFADNLYHIYSLVRSLYCEFGDNENQGEKFI